MTLVFTVAFVLFARLNQANAQTQFNGGSYETVEIGLNKGRLIQLPSAATNIFIADPTIADFQAPSARAIFIFGMKTGTTTLYALGRNDTPILSLQIAVTHDIATLANIVEEDWPEAEVDFRSTPKTLVVRGSAPDAATAAQIVALSEGFLEENGRVLNQLSIGSSLQVNIQVRIAEVSRKVSRELGLNWESIFQSGEFAFGLATGRSPIALDGAFIRGSGNTSDTAANVFGQFVSNSGNVSITSMIDLLEAEGLVTILAEPNLTAVSGETASFLAGGEFPVPVATDEDTITVEFKQFGVVLNMTPTVISGNRINLHVRPEVSDLTDKGAVTLAQGFQIPAISVRRAETTVELASGQSFAIAGLMSNQGRTQLSSLPGLGDIPILGALFRSEAFQRDETELVIIATAYIVDPTGNRKIATPLDGLQPTSSLERLFFKRLLKRSEAPVTGEYVGSAGFYY